uniref:Uncharacterized protein n=1 Tax=Vespula pensylvanica TaxID=30213 RepID=A0A834P429_VESPE|nr:hypothetical protein H0235_007132 [Vespula pensylvanica]
MGKEKGQSFSSVIQFNSSSSNSGSSGDDDARDIVRDNNREIGDVIGAVFNHETREALKMNHDCDWSFECAGITMEQLVEEVKSGFQSTYLTRGTNDFLRFPEFVNHHRYNVRLSGITLHEKFLPRRNSVYVTKIREAKASSANRIGYTIALAKDPN